MNKIKATITNIENEGSVNLVHFKTSSDKLIMLSLELEENIKVGTKVILRVKPTFVAIAKDITDQISYSNRILATIIDIEVGKILVSVKAKLNDETILESIITKYSYIRMNLKIDDKITMMIKATELSILEVYND